jgi:hypothetical protein
VLQATRPVESITPLKAPRDPHIVAPCGHKNSRNRGSLTLLPQAPPCCGRPFHLSCRNSGFTPTWRAPSLYRTVLEAESIAHTLFSGLPTAHELDNGTDSVSHSPAAAAEVYGDQAELDRGHQEAGTMIP